MSNFHRTARCHITESCNLVSVSFFCLFHSFFISFFLHHFLFPQLQSSSTFFLISSYISSLQLFFFPLLFFLTIFFFSSSFYLPFYFIITCFFFFLFSFSFSQPPLIYSFSCLSPPSPCFPSTSCQSGCRRLGARLPP
jgi:hypothetical protein